MKGDVYDLIQSAVDAILHGLARLVGRVFSFV